MSTYKRLDISQSRRYNDRIAVLKKERTCHEIHPASRTGTDRSRRRNAVREALDVKSGVLCPELSEWLSGTSGSYRDLYREMERSRGQFDEPLALCGLSLGGMLALNYAAEHEAQVKALVLIGTQPSVPKMLLKIQNTVFRIMPAAAFGSMGFDKKTVLSLSRSMENLDFRNDLGQIFCRTLVVCGEKDRANRRAAIETQAGRFLPRGLSVIPNAGHEVNTENPAGLGRILNRFFAAQADFQGKIEEKEMEARRMNIRKAEKKDASRLAEILIFAKRTAYRPIFKNDYVSFQEMQVLDLALDFRDRPDAFEGNLRL